MNIRQAKDYIKNSVNLYLKKDEFGEYRVPVVRQRPIFLLGAPGIEREISWYKTVWTRTGPASPFPEGTLSRENPLLMP